MGGSRGQPTRLLVCACFYLLGILREKGVKISCGYSHSSFCRFGRETREDLERWKVWCVLTYGVGYGMWTCGCMWKKEDRGASKRMRPIRGLSFLV